MKEILFGVAVGDALGLPVEFQSREYLKENHVTDMQGYGTHNQPTGTWSDDTALTLCLAESIAEGFDLNSLAAKFIAWKNFNYLTAHGEVFDIGNTTREAIGNLESGVLPELAGCDGEMDNGNGSLMRILPLVMLTHELPVAERFEMVKKVSSLTHRHIRSVTACFYYLEFARKIIEGKSLRDAYKELQTEVTDFLTAQKIDVDEISKFSRLLHYDIFTLPESDINSGYYVIDTLEASIWCLFTTNNFKDAVLKVVNLGEDTDTNGAVTGGLAALYYGIEKIPKQWIGSLACREKLFSVAEISQ